MDEARSISRFQELLRLPTVSILDEEDGEQSERWEPFDRFIAALERLYPEVHAGLDREIVAGHSLLYRWTGSGSAAPIVLMAHYDVVPATDEGWSHPPFAAEIADGVIWGRGTLDDKGALVAILEAVERLLLQGFVPANDVYLSFGHNEETYGASASTIVDLLESRGIRPALVLDEGGAIVEGIFPGVRQPIAVIGVSEKGVGNVVLSVRQGGGHAASPPRLTATARLARAISRLNDRPFPAQLNATTREMVGVLGGQSTRVVKLLFTNLWLTAPIVKRVLGRLSDETRAMIRTTQAVTELQGSLAPNALAERASATVNVRIAVGSNVAATLAHIRRAVADDAVEISVASASEPSPVSPSSGAAWNLVGDSIAAVYPGTIVTPYIMFAASDSRHFARVSDHVYRFSPFRMSAEERATLHAKDERMRLATWLTGIDFYEHLLRFS